MSGRVAYYGNVAIPRIYCGECAGYSLVVDGEKRCCGEPVTESPTKVKRMSDCARGRKNPKISAQREILLAQGHLCFYCERQLGSVIYRGKNPLRLRTEWDHVSPYAYSLNSRSDNFVAACHVCNRIKRALVFTSIEQARTYIFSKWDEKRYGDSPDRRER